MEVLEVNELTLTSKIDQLSPEAREKVYNARSQATRTAIKKDLMDYEAWCKRTGANPVPATDVVVVEYITDMSTRYKVATIKRHVSSISQLHEAMGVYNPTRSQLVRDALKGVARELTTAQTEKAPVMVKDIQRMNFTEDLFGARDKALILVGFAGAFRRSELVSLTVEDLTFTDEGLVIFLARSKTDKEGEGTKVAIHYGFNNDTCPVAAMRKWLEVSGITTDHIFRGIHKGGKTIEGPLSDKGVALIVKRYVESIGLDPTKYAGHSLRAGLVTQAAANPNVNDRDIMKQTRHKTHAMLMKYTRDARLFKNNVTAQLGL